MIDVLVIGQGLSGSWLAWWLEKAGLSFRVADDPDGVSASRVAAGVINPVTGRRIVKTWMIDELMPFARKAYREMGTAMNANLLRETSMIDFFPSPQMLLAFRDRVKEDPAYLTIGEPEDRFGRWLTGEFGFGIIEPCLLVDVPGVLTGMRSRLIRDGKLIEKKVAVSDLAIGETSATFAGEAYRRVVCCDGAGPVNASWFRNLPFAPNKGEALILRIPDLPRDFIYKKSMTLTPWQEDLFWVGSSYEWEFATDRPTDAFRIKAESLLRNWLKVPYEITDHLAAVRPATIERRPFAGFHPSNPVMGMLNGMGTKGCSLAPWFARELVRNIKDGSGNLEGADLARFSRLLNRDPAN